MAEDTRITFDRDNFALTIFVPWDCNKNCSFCTTKKDYKKKLSTVKNIRDTAEYLLKKFEFFISDIVISGGEPLDNIDGLLELLKLKESWYTKKYLNTSFPKIREEDRDKFKELLTKIDGINISRHVGHNYSEFASYEEIIELVGNAVPVRINILLNEHLNPWATGYEAIVKHIEEIKKYNYFNIQLRANYNLTNAYAKDAHRFGLDTSTDMTSMYIRAYGNATYTSCGVCSTISAPYNKKGNTISFHKGLRSTASYYSTDYSYHINDLIITASNEVKIDWDEEPVLKESLVENTAIIRRIERGYGRNC